MKLIDLFEAGPPIDNINGLGAVGASGNIDYLGLRVWVKPSVFLKLAAPHPDPRSDYIEKYIAAGEPIGAPFLSVHIPQEWFSDESRYDQVIEGDLTETAEITGHEGRHRMTAILKHYGDDPVETHLLLNGLRRRHLTDNMITRLNKSIFSQTGKLFNGPWFELAAVNENMDHSKDTQAVDEIIQMPPGSAVPPSDLVRWAYNDSIEKDANPTKINLVKDKQSLMFDLGNYIRIFVMLEDNPIFYLGLRPYEDGYKVGVVHAEPEARGQGLGINIYTALVDQINKPIYSDTTQTNDSRLGIWQKLIDRFPDRVVGYDQKTKEDLPLTKGSYGPTVRGKEPIYAPKKSPNDQANADSTLNRTRLLKLLPAINDASLDENFADGKGPGRPGDSARHGIPKNATLAQLDSIGKGSGRKAQLARWQANMRRGRRKAQK